MMLGAIPDPGMSDFMEFGDTMLCDTRSVKTYDRDCIEKSDTPGKAGGLMSFAPTMGVLLGLFDLYGL